MTPGAQEALCSLWRALEKTPIVPTVNMVMRIARDEGGFKFTNVEAKALLSKFSDRRRQSGIGPFEHEKQSAADPSDRLRGGVVLVPSPSTVPTLLSVATEREAKAVPMVAKQEPLFAVETAMKEKTARAHGNPKPEHLLLDAIGPLVKPFLNLISMPQWRKENARIARDLVACGVTPPQAARYWNLAFENDQEDKVITLKGLRWYIDLVQKEEASAPKLVRMSSADDNW